MMSNLRPPDHRRQQDECTARRLIAKQPGLVHLSGELRHDHQCNIFYLCPDIEIQSAGIRRLYRHVYLLNQAGFNAHIMHLKYGFHLMDMPEVPVRFLEHHVCSPNDIIVIPEGCPTIMDALKDSPGRRFAIALNWDYVFKDLPAGMDWRSLNIERVLTISQVIGRMISWSMGLPTHVLSSSIDHGLYYVDDNAKQPRIVFISRKAAQIGTLKRLMDARNHDFVDKIEWIGLHGLSEEEYAARIREASIFLNLSEAEGYPTSCLEAMASGTLVAGYDSVGGKGLLCGHGAEQNCLLAPIGDYVSLAYTLEPALKGLLEGKFMKCKQILSNGLKTVDGLTPENETTALISFWRHICFR